MQQRHLFSSAAADGTSARPCVDRSKSHQQRPKSMQQFRFTRWPAVAHRRTMQRKPRRGFSTAASINAKTGRSVLEGPPPGYDYKEVALSPTRELVMRKYPELIDLVDEGALIVVERPESYVERRTDGFQEPKEVFLVATAHLSAKSCKDVKRTIEAVQPQSVVVELCRSRAGLMYTQPPGDNGNGGDGVSSGSMSRSDRKASNPLFLSGTSFLGAIGRSSQLGGQSALLLRLLLGRVATRISAQTGLETGGEMRAAQEAGTEAGAEIVLGDRPLEITLRRAWEALSWKEKARLVGALVSGLFLPMPEIDAELVESLKEDEAVSVLFSRLGTEYPNLLQALVLERDLFLAWSLKRSKAVNGTERVVGVIGRGHLRGVVHALASDSRPLLFKDLVGRDGGGSQDATRPRLKMMKDVGKRLAWELALGVLFLSIVSVATGIVDAS